MRYFTSLLILVWVPFSLNAQTQLEYRLEKDDVFTIQQDAKQVITQELDGATHELINAINGVLEFKVLEERDSTYEIELTFKDLNLKMTSSIQGELMDVHAKEVSEEDMQSKVFHSLLNRPIQMILTRTGDIVEVHGGDSLVARMTEASGLKDEFSLKMMKKSLQKEFGSEALSQSYKQMTYIYPEKRVKIGDSWKNSYSGKLAAENTWILEGLSENETRILGTADVSMDVTENAATMRLTGTQKTHIKADRHTGFIQKMTVEAQSEGTSTLTQMDDQEIPTTIESMTTYELMDAALE